MRFLHLADLHLGKIVNGFSMLEDQIYILDQIIALVREHRPQAVVIAGDIYDRPMPGTDAVKVFDQFLTDLVQEQVIIMVISGNHDSPERLSFASRIMAEQQIHIYSVFEGVVHTVEQRDEFGLVKFHLLPFVRPANVRPFFPEKHLDSYYDALKTVLQSIEMNASDRHVLIAHQFVNTAIGTVMERSESETVSVGGLDAVDLSLLSHFDYVALGHLHGPQKVSYGHVRYSGSPLKYSFSESHHNKSVYLVDLGEKGFYEVKTLLLTPIRDMRKIKGPIEELLDEKIAAQGNPQDYLHITLTDEEEMVDAIGRLRNVYPHVMTLTFENTRTAAGFNCQEEMNLKDMTPLELFASFYQQQNGGELDEHQKVIVEVLLERIGEQI